METTTPQQMTLDPSVESYIKTLNEPLRPHAVVVASRMSPQEFLAIQRGKDAFTIRAIINQTGYSKSFVLRTVRRCKSLIPQQAFATSRNLFLPWEARFIVSVMQHDMQQKKDNAAKALLKARETRMQNIIHRRTVKANEEARKKGFFAGMFK